MASEFERGGGYRAFGPFDGANGRRLLVATLDQLTLDHSTNAKRLAGRHSTSMNSGTRKRFRNTPAIHSDHCATSTLIQRRPSFRNDDACGKPRRANRVCERAPRISGELLTRLGNDGLGRAQGIREKVSWRRHSDSTLRSVCPFETPLASVRIDRQERALRSDRVTPGALLRWAMLHGAPLDPRLETEG